MSRPALPLLLCRDAAATAAADAAAPQVVFLQRYDQGRLLSEQVLRVAQKDVRKKQQKKQGKKQGAVCRGR